MADEYIVFNNKTQPAINDNNLNRLQQMIKQDIQGAVSGDTLPVGAIMPFAGEVVPENWLLCDGRPVSRTEYSDLFNTLGIAYGQGDGFTTFNLPKVPYSSSILMESDKEGLTDMFSDGKPVYVKKINFGSLPNAGTKNVNVGLNMSEIFVIDIQGIIKRRGAEEIYKLNWFSSDGGLRISFSLQSNGNLAVGVPYDATPYDGYFTIYYTKNTDNTIKYSIIKAKQTAGVVAQVVDNLSSTSLTDALSANQGRALLELIRGKTLFENTSGVENQDITLNESVANYSYIDIVYSQGSPDGKGYATQRIYAPNNKRVNITICDGITDGYMAIYTATISISTNTIRWINGKGISIHEPDASNALYAGGWAGNNQIKIYKVIGYKG